MTDTEPTTLPAGEPLAAAPSPQYESSADAARRAGLGVGARLSRWFSIPAFVLAVVFLVSLPIMSALPSEVIAENEDPWIGNETAAPFARTPASAQPVADRIVFGDLGDEAEQYPPDGDIYFVTVTEPSQSVLSWFVGRDEPAIQFLTQAEKFGLQTPQQRKTFALESMRTSGQTAQYLALQRVGYDVELISGDVLIEAMVCLETNDAATECVEWSPSNDVLEPGDRIIEVEGVAIEGVEDLTDVLKGFAPGDVVVMLVDNPEDGETEVEVELTASPDDPDRTIVGFYPFDTRRVELPFELNINTGSIGGPSAGLAFTLTIVDELTEGELTGGGSVAVTGKIKLDGSVRAIGGLRQKASAVSQTGVDVFIVPSDQSDEDIAAAQLSGGEDLQIIQVATLDEAIDVLAELGGDPIPPRPDTD